MIAGSASAHAWSIEQTAKELNTAPVRGLTSAEARARIKRYGYNELKEKERPPRPVKAPIINTEMLFGIAVQAVVMTAAVLGAYLFPGAHPHASASDPMLPSWETVAFATLTVSELLRAFTARSERLSVFRIGLFSNKWMVCAVGLSLGLLLLAVYVPFLQPIFGTVPLSISDWLWILPFSPLASITAEATKVYLRARARRIGFACSVQMELA